MTARRLLYLNTHRLSAYGWRQGRLLPEGVFAADAEGLANFAEYVDANRGSQFALLANVADEGHVVETIPFLFGRDRQAVIRRKIGQHFLGTPLAAAFSLGYEKTKRKNEKLLISALTNPDHVEPWLQCLGRAEAPLAGVYTLAQLGGSLLRKLGHRDERCLLITLQDHSIRESFLVKGQTLFSRMAPVTDSSIAGIASGIATEAGKLTQYLISQRQIGRNEALRVFIVAHPLAIPAIEKACPERDNLRYAFIDSHQAAARLGLRTPPEDSRSTPLFLHLLETARPRRQFAEESYRHDFRISQIRRGLVATGLVALLGGALFSAKEIYQASIHKQEAEALTASAGDLDGRYRTIAATFPRLGVDNRTLRRLTGRYVELSRQQRLPGPAYRMLSQALDPIPEIVLQDIEWKIGRPGPDSAQPPAGDQEILTVHGLLHPGRSETTRQLLGTFNRFTDLLKRDAGNTVTVRQQPVDLESGRELRGGDSEGGKSPSRPFVVEIARKLAP